MKRLIAIALGLTLLVGGSIAFAGGYVHTSDDESVDATEESQELEADEQDAESDGDGPGQQVATGADYDGSTPRGLEVAQIAIADHKGELPNGFAQSLANATTDRSAAKTDHAQGSADTSSDDDAAA